MSEMKVTRYRQKSEIVKTEERIEMRKERKAKKDLTSQQTIDLPFSCK